MKGKRVPKEIREEILNKIKNGETVSELTMLYGLGQKTIYSWLDRDSNHNYSLEVSRLKRENDALKILIGQLSLDKSKLKKNKRSRKYA